jgi:hypothetical protein
MGERLGIEDIHIFPLGLDLYYHYDPTPKRNLPDKRPEIAGNRTFRPEA